MLEEELPERAYAEFDDPISLCPRSACPILCRVCRVENGRSPLISGFHWGLCSGVHPVGLTTCPSGGGTSVSLASVSGPLTPMRLASQRVSGKVSNIKTRKIVRGAARNAPGPPSSHAQKINRRKRTVGEM